MKNRNKSELEKELVKLHKRITELEKSETQGKLAELENILNTSPIHIASIDMSGKYTSWNRASEDMFGYTAEEVIGKLTPSKFHRNDKEARDVIDTVEREGRFDDEITFVRKDYSEFPAQLLVSKTIDSSGNHIGYTGVAVDISDRKQSEKIQLVLFNITNAVNTTKNLDELYKIIHKQLGKVIDTTNFYIANYNEETGEIIASYFVDEMFDVKPPVKLRTKGFTAYIIRNKKSLFLTKEKRKKLIELGEIAKREWKSKVWLGVPLIIENRVVGALAVLSYRNESLYTKKDIFILEFVADAIALAIKHKQAEKALLESEEKYRELINTSVDGVISVDSQMRIILWNQGAVRIFGYTEEEMLGQSLRKIIPEKYRKAQENGFEEFARSGLGPVISNTMEIKGLRKDGTEVAIELSVSSREVDRTYIATAIVRDITERKQVQKELEDIYAKSEKSRKSLLSILEDVTKKEAALQISQKRFQDIVTNSEDWIWETDKKGCYTYCSPVMYLMKC